MRFSRALVCAAFGCGALLPVLSAAATPAPLPAPASNINANSLEGWGAVICIEHQGKEFFGKIVFAANEMRIQDDLVTLGLVGGSYTIPGGKGKKFIVNGTSADGTTKVVWNGELLVPPGNGTNVVTGVGTVTVTKGTQTITLKFATKIVQGKMVSGFGK